MSELLKDIFNSKLSGTMVPVIATLPDNPEGEVVFIIKEDKYYIEKTGNDPDVSIRNSVVETDSAFAFLTMFMFDNNKDLLYHCWFNYYDETGKEMVQKLCTQKRIIFEYRDSNLNKGKQFMVDNYLTKFARDYIIKSFEYGHWSVRDFNILKNTMYDRFPSEVEMWDQLEADEKKNDANEYF